jgi:hypothetical protein
MLFTIKYGADCEIMGFYLNIGTFLYELAADLTVINMENNSLYCDLLYITENGQPIKRDFYEGLEAIYADNNYIVVQDYDQTRIMDYQLNTLFHIELPIKKLIIAGGDIFIWDTETCLNYSTGDNFTGSPLDEADKITNRCIVVRSNINRFDIYNLQFEITKLYISCTSIEAAYDNFICVSELVDTNINYYGKFGDIYILQLPF